MSCTLILNAVNDCKRHSRTVLEDSSRHSRQQVLSVRRYAQQSQFWWVRGWDVGSYFVKPQLHDPCGRWRDTRSYLSSGLRYLAEGCRARQFASLRVRCTGYRVYIGSPRTSTPYYSKIGSNGHLKFTLNWHTTAVASFYFIYLQIIVASGKDW